MFYVNLWEYGEIDEDLNLAKQKNIVGNGDSENKSLEFEAGLVGDIF